MAKMGMAALLFCLTACGVDNVNGPKVALNAFPGQPVPGTVNLTVCDNYPLTATPDCP